MFEIVLVVNSNCPKCNQLYKTPIYPEDIKKNHFNKYYDYKCAKCGFETQARLCFIDNPISQRLFSNFSVGFKDLCKEAVDLSDFLFTDFKP